MESWLYSEEDMEAHESPAGADLALSVSCGMVCLVKEKRHLYRIREGDKRQHDDIVPMFTRSCNLLTNQVRLTITI
jgi:hypothetical protein